MTRRLSDVTGTLIRFPTVTELSDTPLSDLPRRSGGAPVLTGDPDVRLGGLAHISTVLRSLDLPDDVMQTITDTEKPGLPLGWEGVPIVE